MQTNSLSDSAIAQAWRQTADSLALVKPPYPRQAIERRGRAIDQAMQCILPTTRMEGWKYTSIRPLLALNVGLAKDDSNSEPKESSHQWPRRELVFAIQTMLKTRLAAGAWPIVFVDGELAPEWPLPTADVTAFSVRPLQEVEASHPADWWDFWDSKMIHDSKYSHADGLFRMLNCGLGRGGLLVSAKKNQPSSRQTSADQETEQEAKQEALHIFHVVSGASPLGTSSVRFSRVLIDCDADSSLTVFEEFTRLDPLPGVSDVADWQNSVTQIRLGQRSSCRYYRVLNAQGHFHTGSVDGMLEMHSRLECFSLTLGARWARIEINIQYEAPEAECYLDGLYLAQGQEHVDHHTRVDHQAGRCRTYQLYKGILAGTSRAVFNGIIKIRRETQGSEAYQTNKNLLLSTDAEVDTKPQLEIDTDDVKASHGAAIGSVNPDELFYLRSRCIGESEARAMLCRGFADEVVERVTSSNAINLLKHGIDLWFQRLMTTNGGQP